MSLNRQWEGYNEPGTTVHLNTRQFEHLCWFLSKYPGAKPVTQSYATSVSQRISARTVSEVANAILREQGVLPPKEVSNGKGRRA